MNLSARDLTGPRGTASVDKSTQLGRGATATVHPARLGGYAYAAKIFFDDRPFPTAKILAMLANPPSQLADQARAAGGPGGRLAWPVAILTNDKGRDVGFLMPMVDLKAAFPLDYFYDQTLFKKLNAPNEAALSFKLEIARNLSALVADLHEHGHCFIDMKPQNIRVTLGSHEVCLLDCDGFSISGPAQSLNLACTACGTTNRVPAARLTEGPSCGRCGGALLPAEGGGVANQGTRFPAELLSTDYISPEAFRGNTPPSALGESQDRYALAVLLFQLLNRGTHPFQGIPVGPSVNAPTNDEKAARGMYPHGRTPHPSLKPRPHSIHELFDDGLRALFDQAFTGSPDSRPSAKDWAHKIDQLLTSRSLMRCDTFRDDVSHMRFRDKPCPACYLAAIPAIKASPTQVPGTPPARAPAPTPPPAPRTPPPTQSSSSRAPLLIGAIVVIALVLLANNSKEKNNRSVATPNSTSSCGFSFQSESPKELCDLYWGNRMTQCDRDLRLELGRRGLRVDPASSCGQPLSAATNSKTPTERLAEATGGSSEVKYGSSVDRQLWGEAANSVVNAMNSSAKIGNAADSTTLFTGVSIRPFTSIQVWYGTERCADLIVEAGICTQEINGLLCGTEIFSSRDGRSLCIGSWAK